VGFCPWRSRQAAGRVLASTTTGVGSAGWRSSTCQDFKREPLGCLIIRRLLHRWASLCFAPELVTLAGGQLAAFGLWNWRP